MECLETHLRIQVLHANESGSTVLRAKRMELKKDEVRERRDEVTAHREQRSLMKCTLKQSYVPGVRG